MKYDFASYDSEILEYFENKKVVQDFMQALTKACPKFEVNGDKVNTHEFLNYVDENSLYLRYLDNLLSTYLFENAYPEISKEEYKEHFLKFYEMIENGETLRHAQITILDKINNEEEDPQEKFLCFIVRKFVEAKYGEEEFVRCVKKYKSAYNAFEHYKDEIKEEMREVHYLKELRVRDLNKLRHYLNKEDGDSGK